MAKQSRPAPRDKWHGSPVIDDSDGHGILVGNRDTISIENCDATNISNRYAISIDNCGTKDSASVVLY
jgi:hypothetical protein